MSAAIAELFGRPGCDLCLKAAAMLVELGCVLEVSHDPLGVDDMVDFAEHDCDPSALPLIRVTNVYGVTTLWLDGETTPEALKAVLQAAKDRNWMPEEA